MQNQTSRIHTVTRCFICHAKLTAGEARTIGDVGRPRGATLAYDLCATPRTDGASCYERVRHALWQAAMDAASAEHRLRDTVAFAPGGVAELGLPDATRRKLQNSGLMTVAAVEDAYWSGALTEIDGFGPARVRWVGRALAARMPPH